MPTETINISSNSEVTIKGQIIRIIDSLTLDTEGNYSDLGFILVTGNIYAAAFHRAATNDGLVKTFTIDNDGAIGNSTISSLTFDTTVADPSLIYVSGSCYAVAYTGPNGDGWVKTFTIDNTGTISAIVSKLEFDNADGAAPWLTKGPTNICAVGYTSINNTGKVKTFSINNSNVISTVKSTLTFEGTTNACKMPFLTSVSGSYYSVLYANQTLTTGTIKTFTIGNTGILSGIISSLVFDSVYTAYPPNLLSISDTKYLIVYQGSGNRKSINIDYSGNVSSILFIADHVPGSTISAPFTIKTSDPNIYLASIRTGTTGSGGQILTFWVNSDGSLGGNALDNLIYSELVGTTYSRPLHISENIYAVTYGVYTGTQHDTIVKTFALQETFTNNITSDANISGVEIILSDARIGIIETANIISNSTIFTSESSTIFSNSLIYIIESSQVLSNSWIYASDIKIILSNSHIYVNEAVDIYSDSTVCIRETVNINSDASIKAAESTTIVSDSTVTDEIKIGAQTWKIVNFSLVNYRNGDPIPNVTDGTTWIELTSGAYCDYNNNVNNVNTYGRLYNWYAVSDPRNIAPLGWHVPSDNEWKQLEIYLGMSETATGMTNFRGTDQGGKLKESGSAHWTSPNVGATNETDFTGLPGGFRGYDGNYYNLGDYAYFWSSTKSGSSDSIYHRGLYSNEARISRVSSNLPYGFSLRLVKDFDVISTTFNSDSDIKAAETVNINSDSNVYISDTVTILSNSHIQTTDTINISSNSHIWNTYTVNITSDAIIKTADTANINSNSNICILESINIFSNSHIQNTYTIDINSNSYVYVTESVNINSNSTIYITGTVTINSDSSVSGRVDINSNGHIYVTETVNINSDAWIKVTEAIIYSAASIIDPIEKHKRIPDDINPIIRESHLDSSAGPDSGFRIF